MRGEEVPLQSSEGAKTPVRGGRAKAKLPSYLRIVNTVSERIVSGAYAPGSRLPSESQFCTEFGVSPMTLRRALTILIDQGLISTEKGRGTFARSRDLTDSSFRLEHADGGWFDDSTEVRLLSASTTKASERVATMLAIAPGDRVVYLRRLVLQDKSPAMYHVEYVVFDAHRPLVESQLQLTSLHGLLEAGRGRRFPRGQVTLRALSLSAEAARVLGEPPGAPALCLEHVFEDTARRPVSWGWFLLRADLFQLRARSAPE
jgi:GntR family transcriptional regulator